MYSVEEDGDNDQENKIDANKRRESFANTGGKSNCNNESQVIRDKSLEENIVNKNSTTNENMVVENSCYNSEKPTEGKTKINLKFFRGIVLNLSFI